MFSAEHVTDSKILELALLGCNDSLALHPSEQLQLESVIFYIVADMPT